MNLHFERTEVVDKSTAKEFLEHGYHIEMHVVDHCNLNCFGCNHFSPLAQPWYINVQDFENQVKMLNQKLPNCTRFMLLGGEPLLHPQLKDLALIVRQYFPTTKIDILSNGIKANDLTLEDLEFYKSIKVGLCVSGYYGVNIDKFLTNCKKVSSQYQDLSKFNTRLFFSTTLVDPKGQQKSWEERTECDKYSIPCFTLHDYKIYICPFAAHIRLFNASEGYEEIPIDSTDYLNLKEDISLQDLINFTQTNKNICRYCKVGDSFVWHKSFKTREEFLLNKFDLYFRDYKKYNEIYNDSLVYFDFIETHKIEQIDKVYATDMQRFSEIRYQNGKIDIIIPYYHISLEACKQLKNNLLKQSIIEDCCIYFISDNSPDEINIWSTFGGLHKSLNCVFLKTKYRVGPGMARQLAINNSYNKYLFFLDADDLLIDTQGLEKIYNKAIETNCDIVTSDITNIYNYSSQKFTISHDGHPRLYKRSFIQENDIHFLNSFVYEDNYFIHLADLYNPHIEIIHNLNLYLYIKSNPNSHANETTAKEKLELLLLTSAYLVRTTDMRENNPKYYQKFINTEFKDKLNSSSMNISLNFKNFIESLVYYKDFNGNLDEILKICLSLKQFFPDVLFWEEYLK